MRHPGGATLLVLALCIWTPSSTRAARQGLIRGTVVNDHGAPVEGALVKATPLGVILATMVPEAHADADGRFTIVNLPWGRYAVSAMKPSAGYPDTSFAFYANRKLRRITISARSPRAEVNVRLGPKAAVLAGYVSDAITGKPMNATFDLIRAGLPHSAFGISQPPHYRVLIPSSAIVNVNVWAPGYRAVHYRGIKLASGVEKRLDIRLEPLKPGTRKKK